MMELTAMNCVAFLVLALCAGFGWTVGSWIASAILGAVRSAPK